MQIWPIRSKSACSSSVPPPDGVSAPNDLFGHGPTGSLSSPQNLQLGLMTVILPNTSDRFEVFLDS